MRDDCTITHISSYSDDAYASEAAGTTTTRTVKCIATPYPRPVEIEPVEERMGVLNRWHLIFPLGQGPAEGDRLSINGRTMTVEVVQTPQSFTTADNVEAAEIT